VVPGTSSGFFKRADAPALYYRLHLSANPKGVVCLIHGFAEHSGRYEELAAKLARAGFDCIRYDLRGHGRSDGKPADVERFDAYAQDQRELVEYLRRQQLIPACALHIVAHSMGALIALQYGASHPENVASLVLSSPCLAVALRTPLKIAARVVSMLIPGFYFKQPVAAAQLSHDAGKVREYLEDPLIHKRISARLLGAMMREGDRLSEKSLVLTVPFLMMLAGSDRIVDNAKSLSFYERLRAPQKKILVLEGQRHEIFNEVEREKVYDSVLSFLIRIPAECSHS